MSNYIKYQKFSDLNNMCFSMGTKVVLLTYSKYECSNENSEGNF